MPKLYCERSVADAAATELLDRVFMILERPDLPQEIVDAFARGGKLEMSKVFKALAIKCREQVAAGEKAAIDKIIAASKPLSVLMKDE